MSKSAIRAAHRKGKGLRFPYLDKAADGNVSEPGDAGDRPWEEFSFLFNSSKALESNHSEIGLSGW